MNRLVCRDLDPMCMWSMVDVWSPSNIPGLSSGGAQWRGVSVSHPFSNEKLPHVYKKMVYLRKNSPHFCGLFSTDPHSNIFQSGWKPLWIWCWKIGKSPENRMTGGRQRAFSWTKKSVSRRSWWEWQEWRHCRQSQRRRWWMSTAMPSPLTAWSLLPF